MKWEKLPNGKWKPIKEGIPYGKVYPDGAEYSKRLRSKLKKIHKFCNQCNKTYDLADPCVHHLTDSPEHRMLYKAYQQQIKKKKTTTDDNAQSKL